MRWNQYLWLSQQEANRREYVRRARRQAEVNLTAESIKQRLLENPTKSDVASGDALNIVLDQVTDPRIHSSALRLATDPLNTDVIDDIPFQNASEAVTLSLHQLTAKDAWPNGLLGPEFAPERKAWEQTVEQALKEDEEGRISPQTLNVLRSTASRLKAKLDAFPPADKQDLINARDYVKMVIGLSRMLGSPQIEKVLAELEKTHKTTLGSLLAFMHTYNLRFGVATTPEQRNVYDTLYPKLVAFRDRVVKEAVAVEPPPPGKGKPSDFFQGMHLEHLDNKGGGVQ